MFRKLASLATATIILCGCATKAPPYSLPLNVPSASLKSEINGAYDYNESIDVYLFDNDVTPPGNRTLFSIRRAVSTPAGYVQVPANVPLNLMYFESASGGRYCQLNIKVILEQGKSYSLVGGFVYDKGPIPVFTDTRKCRFGAIDESTKTPVPYR
ncbi:MAG TPA: hypothetical protein VFP33_11845 [Gallionella sp.]|nr:hypothetical protein [Gallionella sp.]